MTSKIPYFYSDLIARMVPGAVVLLLLKLASLVPPDVWLIAASLPEKALIVIIPVLLASLAYAIGTVFEAVLIPWLERKYIRAFEHMAEKYAWSHTMTGEINRELKTAKHLSRVTFSRLILGKSEEEREAISHLVRFHAEAKMCFALSLILTFFSFLVLIDLKHDFWIMPDLEGHLAWLMFVILLLSATSCWYAVPQRLRSRALFVFRAIDLFGDDEKAQELKRLREQLWVFSESCGNRTVSTGSNKSTE